MDVLLKLNKIRSHIYMCGNIFCKHSSDIIVIVCGSPGIVDFYSEFSSLLHANTGIPVCVVGHAGHEIIPDHDFHALKKKGNLFDLSGQIEHKLDLINNYVNNHARLHLVGHSVGSWMILELLDKNRSLLQRVSSVQLLFPALQRVAETENCKKKNKLSYKFTVLSLKLLHYCLPKFVLQYIICQYVKYVKWPLFTIEACLKMNPKVLDNIHYLLNDEVEKVTQLNVTIIDRIKHLTNIIYGSTDGWAPLHYMENLEHFQPSIQLNRTNFSHAFVLNSEECSAIAMIVSDFIYKNKTCPTK